MEGVENHYKFTPHFGGQLLKAKQLFGVRNRRFLHDHASPCIHSLLIFRWPFGDNLDCSHS